MDDSRGREKVEIEAGGQTIVITHPDRVVFPRIKATKQEIAEYYLRMADRIVPETKGRAMVLHRFPRGVESEGFYQKRAPENPPSFVETAELPSPTNEGSIEYVLGENLATLIWLSNLGAFDMN